MRPVTIEEIEKVWDVEITLVDDFFFECRYENKANYILSIPKTSSMEEIERVFIHYGVKRKS